MFIRRKITHSSSYSEKKQYHPTTVERIDTVIKDGMLTSVVQKVEVSNDSYRSQSYRNFCLSSLVNSEALDLLKEQGVIPSDPLSASDVLRASSADLIAFRQFMKERQSVSTPSSNVEPNPSNLS